MKKIIISLVLAFVAIAASAQIPYYGASQGKGKTYTYFSTKFHPGHNNQMMYVTASHGITNYLDLVTDVTLGTGWTYQGFGARFNAVKSKYFSVGGQVTENFNINDNYKPGYTCASLFMDGGIYKGLHWVSNTWYTINHDADNQVDQWTYLGYTIGKFTPMVGAITDCTHDFKTDLAVGVYANLYKGGYVYLWGSGLTNNVNNPSRAVSLSINVLNIFLLLTVKAALTILSISLPFLS
jgi:hypothetical protein